MSLRVAAYFLVLLGAALPAAATEKPQLVATFSILGDITSRIGGNAIDLKTLVGPDGDAHVYQAAAADARAVAEARIIVVNGLSFDDWAARLVRASGSKATIVVASLGVKPQEGDRGHDKHADPHAWQDVRNVMAYVTNIERALIAADPAHAAAYRANASAYRAELQSLDAEIRSALALIPSAQRRAVTTHGSFAYFAAAYGVTLTSPLGTSTEEQASAKSLARLITGVRQTGTNALFLENAADPRLMRQVARETGIQLGGTLYADALSPKDGPAPTYVGLMRHNLKLLTGAMAHGF
ncbi:MAG: zinc ABC transporter solute-binding protein [Alphaproteobacteria bacterium]|nr:zinc ABC transporter solute-binding protein [Alphaproteobacteria bacterium]